MHPQSNRQVAFVITIYLEVPEKITALNSGNTGYKSSCSFGKSISASHVSARLCVQTNVTAGVKNYINRLRGWISAFISQSKPKRDRGGAGKNMPLLDAKKSLSG